MLFKYKDIDPKLLQKTKSVETSRKTVEFFKFVFSGPILIEKKPKPLISNLGHILHI